MFLADDGIQSIIEANTEKVRPLVARHRPGAILLCQNATNGDIEGLSRLYRQSYPSLAIVVCLQNRDGQLEEALLDAGMDDIVTDRATERTIAKRLALRLRKPTSELEKNQGVQMQVGEAVVDFESLRMWRDGQPIRMSRGMARLLNYFMENRSRPITRKEAAEAIWFDSVVDPEGRNLDMHVMKLRRLTERDARNPQIIRTVRGIGYMMH
jgi:DNA-binding response OmpR family regulator